MKIALPLQEMTVAEKLGLMEDMWADLAKAARAYSPPEWHGRILEERRRLAQSGEVGFTDWETAKKQIKDRAS